MAEHSKKSDDDLWSNIESESFDVDVPNITQILSESDVTVRKSEKVRLVSEKSVEIIEHESERLEVKTSDQSLEDFKDELRTKRMRRISIVNGLRDELKLLRHQLEVEREINRRLQNGDGESVEESPPLSDEVIESADEKKTAANHHLMAELAEAQLALQLSNAENLSLTTELGYVRKQVVSLKEVVGCYKEMLSVKETEVDQVSYNVFEILCICFYVLTYSILSKSPVFVNRRHKVSLNTQMVEDYHQSHEL